MAIKYSCCPWASSQGGKTKDRSPIKYPISFSAFSIPLMTAQYSGYCYLGAVDLKSFGTGATGGDVYIYWISIGQ